MVEPTQGPVAGPDGALRCPWAVSEAGGDLMLDYHDTEWGRQLRGDHALFERLCLEAFQSGLSWLTILRKRESFRRAFDGFDPARVASYDETDVSRLLGDPGIVRNRAKVRACIGNAARTLEVAQGDGLSQLVWSFAPAPRPAPRHAGEVPATTAASTALARELRRRGFRFVGPTTAYALMQACGLVDDHLADCVARVAPR